MTTPTDHTAAQGTWQEAADAGRAADAAYLAADAARAAELAASVERARIAAELAGPLAAYDRATEQWQQANAEQNDAPAVQDCNRYSDALENAAHSWAAVVRDLVDAATTKAPADREWGWQGDPRVDLDADDPRHRDAERPAPEGLATFAHWSASHDGINVEVDLPDGLPITVHVNDGLVFQWHPGDDPAAGIVTDPQRTIYVVNWTPEGVGGFEWRRTREEAAAALVALADPTVRVHAVELPADVGDDVEGITAWLDSEGWSDGGDPRVAAPSAAYVLHYTSADAPGDAATWSVYRERYVSRDHDEPIDGSQEHVSTHPTEAEADAEARRLQASANA